MPPLVLRGVRTRNLKGFDIAFEPGTWTSVVGVSGSGKSSLCFHTLHAESQRRFLSAMAPAARVLLENIPRAEVDSVSGLLPTLALEQGAEPSGRFGRAVDLAGLDLVLRSLFVARAHAVSPSSGKALRAWLPDEVSGHLLTTCEGARLQILVPGGTIPAQEWMRRGFVRARSATGATELSELADDQDFEVVVDRLVAQEKFRERLNEAVGLCFRISQGHCRIELQLPDGSSRLEAFHDHPVCPDTGREAPNPSLGLFLPVPSQNGESALNPDALWYRLGGRTVAELLAAPFQDWLSWLSTTGLAEDHDPAVIEMERELSERLFCLESLGLGYLEGGRPGSQVSLGEFHRLRLAHITGFPLSGVCYVLDEPSTGLHHRDAKRLDAHLRALAEAGNTLVVVEHRLRELHSDRVLEIGPGAGALGGNLVADVVPARLSETSGASGTFLRSAPPKRPAVHQGDWLRLSGAHGRNLSDAAIDVPMGRLCGVCGPSGAGKSTLVLDTLVPALSRLLDWRSRAEGLPFGSLSGWETLAAVERIDPGDEAVANPRSMVASLAGLLDPLRSLFAALPEAKMRGLGPERFSPNLKGGRCERCQGLGRVRVDLPYLPVSWTPCPICAGARFSREVLEVRLRGRDLGQILSMSCEQALQEFSLHPKIARILSPLVDAGLGYLPLGFPSQDLSGGELARLRLCARLSGASKPHLVVLDEPTCGLHPQDTLRLVALFSALCARGHTVLAISHDPVLLSRCDWLCELGLGAGADGGRTLLQGDPWALAEANVPSAASLRSELFGGVEKDDLLPS